MNLKHSLATYPSPEVRILQMKQLVKVIGLSTSTIYRLIKEDSFPRGKRLSIRRRGWLVTDIDRWIIERKNSE